MNITSLFLPCAAALITLSPSVQARALFNGKNLDGWTRVNGTANYEIVDGAIVGTSQLKTPNTFLVFQEEFGDFILEFEFKVDDGLNSGVQIRSHHKDNKPEGRFYGYQIEIDPSDRAWSAGIYDEARSGWLYTMANNPPAQKAFLHNEWNKVRVEAIGTSIRTWLNGVPAADLIDNKDASGYIALQVHGIGNSQDKLGKQVAWRNITIETDVEKYRSPNQGEIEEISTIDNSLSAREKAEGWQLLWDGSSSKGWRGAKQEGFPQAGWTIKEGVLTVQAADGQESTHGGDIITEKTYKNFELLVDFRHTKGANSGIKYFVDPELNKGKGSAIGCEFQILDDKEHPDAKRGKNGNRTMGSLYDLIPASADKKPVINKFNRARIVVQDNHVEHWLNGTKILEYERNTPEWDTIVKGSKYHAWPNFGNAATGHILLQDHGNEVDFKNIKIKEL